MKRLYSVLLLSLATTAIAAADEYREIAASHELAAGQAVHIEFHSGDVEIEASDGDRVEIELDIECEWDDSDCDDLFDDVEIDWRSTDRRLYLQVEGLGSWRQVRVEVRATIRVPAAAALSVDMAAGRLVIDERTNDVSVDMGAGELRLWMLESAVESVSIDVAVGDAKFRGQSEYVSGRRAMLVGSEIYWDDGPGKALVDIELGAGDASVWLE